MSIAPTLEAPADAGALLDIAFARDRRALIFGEPGSGKSTLAGAIAERLAAIGRHCHYLSADPGSPAVGAPGALTLAQWRIDGLEVRAAEALCTLDAVRFRLPLVTAFRRLARQVPIGGTLLIDPPGVTRGIGGIEILTAMVEIARVDLVLALVRAGKEVSFRAELDALAPELLLIAAHPEARRPTKRQRARQRTRRWSEHLKGAEIARFDLNRIRILGTPPPLERSELWPGRQIAALAGSGGPVALGEVVEMQGNELVAKLKWMRTAAPHVLLVRDAVRDSAGQLVTVKVPASATLRTAPPPDMAFPEAIGPLPVARVGPVTAVLVNGVFGDPLLHVRFRHQRRSLLFDLGDTARLPTRIIHQVTDIFITHAHFDHIAGFPSLLRARMNDCPSCRLYGPPGIAENIAGFLDGIHWDRIGERGPRFEVGELDGGRLRRFNLQAGKAGPQPLEDMDATGGVLLAEPDFLVRACTLDHGTPVLAFALETTQSINIRKDRLDALGAPPGPWLTALKRELVRARLDTPIALPDGTVERSGTLAEKLVLVTPGEKLAYATDLADTAENRARLARLAAGAHTFICEATFVEEDAGQAARTQHLTAHACGEIATAAGVERLIPFHFSDRYLDEPERVYREVRSACLQTVTPTGR